MNQKLVFVSIIAVVAVFGMSAIAIGMTQTVHAANTSCKSKGLVAANVCGVQACVDVQALTSKSQAICNQQ